MARKKTKMDILRNEKYMDDAVDYVFLNLLKAAKKKSEYIWATEKFSSIDSIWGDPVEPNDSKADVASSDASETQHESKSLKLYYSTGTKQSASPQNGSRRVEAKMPGDVRKIGFSNGQTQENLERQSLSENFVDDDEQKRKKPEHPDVACKVDMSNGEMFKLKRYSKIPNINEVCGKTPEISTRKLHDKSEIKTMSYERNQEKFQKMQNFSDTSSTKLEDHFRYPFEETGQTPLLTSFGSNNMTIPNAKKNEDVKSNRDENKFQSDYQKSKINIYNVPQKERTKKKKRHMSSSENSLPELNRFPKGDPTHGMSQDSAKRRNLLQTMILLKIFKEEKVFDFILKVLDFERLKKRYPKLKEVLPEIDGEEKELNYSADAVKVVFKILRNELYITPDERTTIEILAAAETWGIHQLHEEFSQNFLENLNRNNPLAYGAAVHYNMKKICDAYESKFGELSNNKPYKERKCYVSVSTYIEPLEFCISIKTVKGTLRDNFDRDIRNEIYFKSITGSYVITGFHILLNLDKENDFHSTSLRFFYTVKNKHNSVEEKLEIRKPLRPIIAINLHRNIEVNQDQTVEVIIETTIKPYLCSAMAEDDFTEGCGERQFSVNLKSNYKVVDSNEKRFFVGKLLYYPKP